MVLKIKEFAEVQMGYSFRSRLELSEEGNVRVIQMKDLCDDATVDVDQLIKVDMEAGDHHFVKRGDIIFRSRGQVLKPAILLDDIGRVVVAAPLLRIRVANREIVLPEYLNWYLSQREAQAFLFKMAESTVQKMVSRKVIEELDVVVPSIEKQKVILEIFNLSTKEQALVHSLAQKKEKYVSSVLKDFSKGE